METRANYVIVGIFTLLAVLAAFGFVYWTAALGDRGETVLLRFRIPGSASGLARGSAVMFNGVRVGEIQRVYIDVTNPSAAVADAMVDKLTPVTQSTKAIIGLAGLTGTANVEMNGSSVAEPNLFMLAEEKGEVPEIIASPSAVTNLLETAQQIATRMDQVLTQVEGFTKDARQPLLQTVQNAEKFSQALARNSDGIDKFLSSVSALSEDLSRLSGRLDGAVVELDQILKAVDDKKIASIVNNADEFTRNLTESSKRFDSVINGADGALTELNKLLGSGDAQGVMAQTTETLRSYRTLADNLNERMAVINEFSETLAAYRQIANTVNGRVAGVMDGLARFTGQGLKDVQSLVQDSRRSVTRIEQAITDLERNPQRIITGGDGEVRQYDGRARR
jgi:phospholipid/cholesterol/gamma-HCH transport system substrate-binding protein